MLNRIFRKIKSKIIGDNKYDHNQWLIDHGILKIGENCDISKMRIIGVNLKKGINSITIGSNSCIKAKIVLYKSESEITIGNDVYIGDNTMIECVEKISIGDFVLISVDCNIIDTNSHSLDFKLRERDTMDWQVGLHAKDWTSVISKGISIESNCWIGLKSIILKGIILRRGTIVAAGSVVTKSTNPLELIAGNPAKFIKTLKFDDENIDNRV